MSNYGKYKMFGEMVAGVYKITNKRTGEFYVGSTTDFDLRWRSHRSSLKRNKQIEINDLEFSIIEILKSEIFTNEKLSEMEQHYINALNPTMNIQQKVSPRRSKNQRRNSENNAREQIKKRKHFIDQKKRTIIEIKSGREFKNVIDVANHYSIYATNVRRVLCGEIDETGGLIFKYNDRKS